MGMSYKLNWGWGVNTKSQIWTMCHSAPLKCFLEADSERGGAYREAWHCSSLGKMRLIFLHTSLQDVESHDGQLSLSSIIIIITVTQFQDIWHKHKLTLSTDFAAALLVPPLQIYLTDYEVTTHNCLVLHSKQVLRLSQTKQPLQATWDYHHNQATENCIHPMGNNVFNFSFSLAIFSDPKRIFVFFCKKASNSHSL